MWSTEKLVELFRDSHFQLLLKTDIKICLMQKNSFSSGNEILSRPFGLI